MDGDQMTREQRGHVWTWLALLALLALTAASAWLPLGVWNGVLNLVIALAKAALVAWRYMALRRHDSVPRLVAATGLAALLLLLCLTAADYGTRVLRPAPWQAPPSARPLAGLQWRGRDRAGTGELRCAHGCSARQPSASASARCSGMRAVAWTICSRQL
jgi:cytochrome c oxidase subunit 4